MSTSPAAASSTLRPRFAKQVHAEAHAIGALRDLHHRARKAQSLDDVLHDINRMIATRVQRLGLPPDVMGDVYESLPTANTAPDPAQHVELKHGDRVMWIGEGRQRFGYVRGYAGNALASNRLVYVRWDGHDPLVESSPVLRSELLHVASNYRAVMDAMTGTKAVGDEPTTNARDAR